MTIEKTIKFQLSEKQIENAILKYLRFRGIFCFKLNTVGVFDPVKKVYRKPHSEFILKGVSDIIAIASGRMIAIEIKVPERRNNLTDAQKFFLSKIEESGGIAFVACSIREVEERLRSEGILS